MKKGTVEYRDYMRGYMKTYKKQNPVRTRRYGRVADWKRRGIVNMTWERFEQLLEAQNYTCPICRNPIDESAHVDHDHDMGEVRGLLCESCNLKLDNVEWLHSALMYLEDRKK